MTGIPGTILPVVTVSAEEDAVELARALAAGGVRAIEITLRTPEAAAAIRAVAAEVPEITVGAGTVTDGRFARAACQAGAAFLVSPGLSESVAAAARSLAVPLIAGVATGTELMRAVGMGLEVVKLFPAHLLGGAAAVDAFSAPFPGLSFVPSGGVDAANLADYLARPAVGAVSGSWLVPRGPLDADALAEVTRRAAAATETVRRLRGDE
ncbi:MULTISPECIES: bifunctional 4-hydroxy-2-oxoglutarate aldolase/2-dehydro-3-deoxy-phosphogluconate aldolase [Microbacterium]|jgi:2-dehydro-3-deoxyphosphogluconate aldolase / (4S)-4-hydroxy-2-oxoglutarate aldolase|uniref:2-dehydro-3-deoxy-phosphogluconate aldolase n=2 Tax=Microbacterium TaxID=33882 RepID=A0A0F0LSX4_9MICO|nr:MULTISPECIES: bifunctional 4-hydroxy-2-oxoglutarate aldolase/2-dehydro-3-deoxy-phosphogluconate aldolase [Microbacterium]MCK9915508.1 bifunctional 4-hydroxy-2-oxoglutarate aldolase/2-dehydro-3-deoxy-phosphogluconate aldolase [Microbacteriaceae bacterium K1510]KJL36218.1 KHG/KDPG aldolase [Microbacterium ginsengisoli]MBN9198292.1 bifunctional 4-hydroxy-2-oxoglutarate aldolase/2-dehydro-3-deoxy-phosphogluconate aldolase [Microbacterium ginsengisoli]MBN9208229.1 bifunctional 4-hydroxy-2-oxoglut